MSILNTPISINGLALGNRLVMPPMATAKCGEDGRVTQPLCEHYDEKTRGGYVGMVIVEHSFISPEGRAGKGQLSIADDGAIEGLSALVRVVHKNKTPIVAQINHAGGAAREELIGQTPMGASTVRIPKASASGLPPREMSQSDIETVTADFAHAAQRAKQAGFDGVELHSAYGYLLNQFFSPLTNKRTDRYGGGSIDGRIRLHLEVIRAVRAAVGESYPLFLRLGARDYLDGGTTLDDSVAAAVQFERAGVDMLDITGGFCSHIRQDTHKQGHFKELSSAIKRSVSIPVMLTGGIVDAGVAERLLSGQKADLIGVGRALLEDSQWARRAFERLSGYGSKT